MNGIRICTTFARIMVGNFENISSTMLTSKGWVKLTLCCNIMLVNWIIPLSRPCTGMVKSEPAKFDRTVHLPYAPAATLLLLPCSASTAVRVFTHENNPDMVRKALINSDIVAECGLNSHSISITSVSESPPNRTSFFRDAKRNMQNGSATLPHSVHSHRSVVIC